MVSGTSVSDACRTTHEPQRWSSFFDDENSGWSRTWRSPITMSARCSRIGPTSFGMSSARYWLSASVLTMTSAPSFSAASRPAWKATARPLFCVNRTTWSTPWARATSTVRSVDPSSMISHSTSSKPSTSRGSSESVTGSVASSLRQGIWMISFTRARGLNLPRGLPQPRGSSRFRTLPRSLRGRASSTRTSRGRLCGASARATCVASRGRRRRAARPRPRSARRGRRRARR